MPQDGKMIADVSDPRGLSQFLAAFIMETNPGRAKEHALGGIREALEEARLRMKYAAAEYTAIGAHEEAERAAEIRGSIMALYMERW